MSRHMAVVYKHAIANIHITTFHMTIAFHIISHITSICTSYLSLLTRKHSKVSSRECLRQRRISSTREWRVGTRTRFDSRALASTRYARVEEPLLAVDTVHNV